MDLDPAAVFAQLVVEVVLLKLTLKDHIPTFTLNQNYKFPRNTHAQWNLKSCVALVHNFSIEAANRLLSVSGTLPFVDLMRLVIAASNSLREKQLRQ